VFRGREFLSLGVKSIMQNLKLSIIGHVCPISLPQESLPLDIKENIKDLLDSTLGNLIRLEDI
jgi:hypothetical protein